MRTKLEVEKAFTPVGKLSAEQGIRLMKITNAFKDLATDIIDLVPEAADRTSALRKLLNAKFECVQAITHSAELTKQTEEKPVAKPVDMPVYSNNVLNQAKKGAQNEQVNQSDL